MDASRLSSVMKSLATDTVWGELLAPAMRTLETVRYPAKALPGPEHGRLSHLGRAAPCAALAGLARAGAGRAPSGGRRCREAAPGALDLIGRPGLAQAPGGADGGVAGARHPRPGSLARSPPGDPRAGPSTGLCGGCDVSAGECPLPTSHAPERRHG